MPLSTYAQLRAPGISIPGNTPQAPAMVESTPVPPGEGSSFGLSDESVQRSKLKRRYPAPSQEELNAQSSSGRVKRAEVQKTPEETLYESQLGAKMDEVLAQVRKWVDTIYAPVLNPSSVVDEVIKQRIREYEKKTDDEEGMTPDTKLTVTYMEKQSAKPNLNLTSPVRKEKVYTLKEIVTGTYLNDLRLMRDQYGQVFKVVEVEQQALVDFISKGNPIQKRLNDDFAAYKARPGIKEQSVAYYESRVRSAALNYLERTPVTDPGYKLMSAFLSGDIKASQVKFHGAVVNGVFAVTQGEKAVLCSVDDDISFYIGEKNNRYWKFGARQSEPEPAYPTDPKFKEWITQKLPIIEQLKTQKNKEAFNVIKNKDSTNAHIGILRTVGRINTKPFSFEAQDSTKKLAGALYEGNIARVDSDIDSLVYTKWEDFGLEALSVIKHMLNTFSFLSVFGSAGTGTFMLRALSFAALGGANAGVSALQAAITDDPTERDGANRAAFISLVATAIQTTLSGFFVAGGKAIEAGKTVDKFSSAIGYQRFAKQYINANMPRIVREYLGKRLGGNSKLPIKSSPGTSPAPTPVPGFGGVNVPWNKMNNAQKIEHVQFKVTTSATGLQLIGQTSKHAVRASIANNLLPHGSDPQVPRNWNSGATETKRAIAKLQTESKRLKAIDEFLGGLRTNTPALEVTPLMGQPLNAAAAWVAASSSVKLPQEQVRKLIEQFQHADLTDMRVIEDIQRSLSGTSTGFRATGTSNLLGTDIAHAAFEARLKPLDIPAGLSRASWLFALTKSYQPFGKNNDPLARVLYALADLQDSNNNGFKAITKTTELKLSRPGPVEAPTPSNRRPVSAAPPVVDSRVQPFRQIEANPSSELPVKMQGYMNMLRNNPKLSKAFTTPNGQCASCAEIVVEFLREKEFQNIKIRTLLIWPTRNPNSVQNHFIPIGDLDGKTYAFDLTAPQFANRGMPSLSEPMILPEAALMRKYQTANENMLIKYKDSSDLRSAETEFSTLAIPGPNEFIEGGYTLNQGWNTSAATPPGAPNERAPARITAEDITRFFRNRPSAVADRLRNPSVKDAGKVTLPLQGPGSWGALSDKDKINHLVDRLLDSEDARALIDATSHDMVSKTIRDNLELDGLGEPRKRFAWGGLDAEMGNGLRRLASDRTRLDATNKAMRALLDTPPAVAKETRLGNPQEAAAKWIVGQSRSDGLTEAEVRDVLLRYRDADLTDIKQIDRIHAEIYKAAPGQAYRYWRSSSDPVFMSSDIGYAGLMKMLPQLAQSARSGKLPLAEGLFAAAVRFHPYGDGNGRLARTLYALAQIKADGPFFKALTPAGEDTLNPRK